jgi:lysophospholipase L1-like esterase
MALYINGKDKLQDDIDTLEADNANLKGVNQISNFLLKCAGKENVKISLLGDSIGAGVISGGTVTAGAAYLNRLETAIEAKYSIACTIYNNAVAGHSVFDAFRGVNKFNIALGNSADLYILSFGHNDIKSDLTGMSPYGYTKINSITALERMIRKIKVKLPNADIMLVSETPYPEESTFDEYNSVLLVYNNEMRKLANMYDVLFVDAYGAFIAKGSWNAYINNAPNDTHPNDDGHELMFETIWQYFNDSIQPGKKNNFPIATYGKQYAYASESDWVECTKDLTTQGNKYW